MNDDVQPGSGPFTALDAKLTMFALANGVDLAKGPDYRRLEWFSDGLERGIVVRAADGGFQLSVIAWKTGKADTRTVEEVSETVPLDGMSSALSDAIDQANGLEAPN